MPRMTRRRRSRCTSSKLLRGDTSARRLLALQCDLCQLVSWPTGREAPHAAQRSRLSLLLSVVGALWRALNPDDWHFAEDQRSRWRIVTSRRHPAKTAESQSGERGKYLARAADCLVCRSGKILCRRPSFTVWDALSTNITPTGDRRKLQRPGILNPGRIRRDARLYPADAVYLTTVPTRAGHQGLF